MAQSYAPSSDRLVLVLEKLFEPDALSQNFQLQTILRKKQFVTLQDLLSFPEILAVTESEEELLEAVKLVPNRLTLDETESFVVPRVPHHRTTLILRDLPADATMDEVKQLFDNPACAKYKEIHPDVNKTWFVTFETEEECVQTATWIQLSAKFRDNQVRCRIKSEHQQKSFFNFDPSSLLPKAARRNKSSSSNGPTDPAVAYYGPKKQGAAPFDPYMPADPDFMDFVHKQLSGPSYEEKNRAKEQHGRAEEVPRNYDENVDYDGIFKLVNKGTFNMVIKRYMDNLDGDFTPPDFLIECDDLLSPNPIAELNPEDQDGLFQ